ncbi:sugar transferase [Cytobacillus sp. S13-E01]|uniref:sugar transferase n=1 Tax=Cytobacillus sp. S13-E01 TaxID=3031326 RepID=UPI0023D83370|nr:sugar transferase [Cytobacillus sp. S13-E01]MDF0727055.1 sugar transferase [Cytobacillus sp. S13-E01]
MKKSKGGIYKRVIKRPMDFILSLIAIVVLSPVLLIVAILVRIKLGSPVLFKQNRPGLNEQIFMMYKFRTMTDERDEYGGELLSDSVRLTNFGKFLRSTSLDELPGLFNILKGDMSIIGPRPLLVRYLPYYREEERLRSKVRPGITGLAQVSGRNALTWDERFQTDVNYVNNLSFILDVKILINTILVVFQRKDILVGSEHIMKDLDVERKDEFNYGLRKQKNRGQVN